MEAALSRGRGMYRPSGPSEGSKGEGWAGGWANEAVLSTSVQAGDLEGSKVGDGMGRKRQGRAGERGLHHGGARVNPDPGGDWVQRSVGRRAV